MPVSVPLHCRASVVPKPRCVSADHSRKPLADGDIECSNGEWMRKGGVRFAKTDVYVCRLTGEPLAHSNVHR